MQSCNRNVLTVFLLLILVQTTCWANGISYKLVVQSTQSNATTLTLVGGHSGNEIWKKTVYGDYKVGWSTDHKSLAVVVNSPLWNSFRLLVWTERTGTRLIAPPSAKLGWGSYENDGVLNFRWSPDDQCLLFRPWGSGEDLMNTATLYCYNTSDNSMHKIALDVRSMTWVGNRGFNYWIVKPKSIDNKIQFTVLSTPMYAKVQSSSGN